MRVLYTMIASHCLDQRVLRSEDILPPYILLIVSIDGRCLELSYLFTHKIMPRLCYFFMYVTDHYITSFRIRARAKLGLRLGLGQAIGLGQNWAKARLGLRARTRLGHGARLELARLGLRILTRLGYRARLELGQGQAGTKGYDQGQARVRLRLGDVPHMLVCMT